MPTVREIAEFAGVSKSTVSMVLNNKSGVSDAMRKRILSAFETLREREAFNSLDSLNGKRFSENEDLSVVVLHPAILRSSQVFSEIMRGIQAGASRHRIQLSLAVNEPYLPDDHISHLYFSDPDLRPDGVLVIGARQDIALPKCVTNLEIPCVLVGRSPCEKKVSTVGRDEESITFDATQYLMELGHKAIAFVGGDVAYSYTQSRINGFKHALETGGITPEDRWVALGPGEKAARKILTSCPEITAVIFINDAYAMQALKVFQSAGRQIPNNLSVISFDDTENARSYNPPLTSVVHPLFQEGLRSLTLLVDQIQNPLIKFCNVVFRSKLIKRDSCAYLKRPINVQQASIMKPK